MDWFGISTSVKFSRLRNFLRTLKWFLKNDFKAFLRQFEDIFKTIVNTFQDDLDNYVSNNAKLFYILIRSVLKRI